MIAGTGGPVTVPAMCNPTTPGGEARDSMCLRELVKQACRAKGFSNSQLVRNVSLSRTYFYKALRGEGLSSGAAASLGAALGVDPAEVLDAAGRTACEAEIAKPEKLSAYGTMVKEAAKAKGIPLGRLPQLARVGRSSIFAAINGSHQPSPEHIAGVASALELDVVELAVAAGEKVDCDADRERLQLGLSRSAYAEHCAVNVAFLFGDRETRWPHIAHRVAVAAGAGEQAAAQAAGAVRRSQALCPLGEVIESGLDRLGWSATQLAEKVGVSRQAIEQWVQGTSRPRSPSREALAEQLGVEVALIDAAIADGVPPHLQVGRKLRELRTAAGLLQADVAKVLGVSDPVVSSLETGTRRLTEPMAAKLAAAYGWDLYAPAAQAAGA